MSRFKSYALWAAVLAFIPLLADSMGVYNIKILLPDNYAELATALLGILVLAGILNNPSKGKGFKDGEE